ncbi:MAG: glutamate synthase central domain-containing protein [Acidimicrobiales bacterium]
MVNETRTKAGLVVEAADAREVHHFALLIGFGAGAVCPSLVFEAIVDRIAWDKSSADLATAEKNYLRAVTKGVIKVMSKMGISTIASYTGARSSKRSALPRTHDRVLPQHVVQDRRHRARRDFA